MDIYLTKVNGALYPADEQAQESLKTIKQGEPVKVKLTRPRNYLFHKKYFALLNLAFDYWEPPENHVAEKNFDRFRKDIIILAGYYESYVRLDGSTRIEPRSIAFGKMSEEEFADLYNKTIDVIIKYALTAYTGDMLRSIVDQVEEFDG
jgi:hypothetical protein